MTLDADNARNAADSAWEKPLPAGNASGILYRCMADIVPKPIHWLWPKRIARGKITMIAGHPGLGKSQLTASMAAIITSGRYWPGSGMRCMKGSVAFICAEDSADDTIRPRLDAAEADVTRVFILDAVAVADSPNNIRQRSFNLQGDVERLDALLAEKPDIVLVVIDPITAYMGGVDSHKTADVRGVLTPLAEMATRRNVAVVCISHLNKSGDMEAMMRVTGSLAYVAAARAAYLVVADKENPERRLFLHMKNNLSSDRTGLAFTIETYSLDDGIESSRVAWKQETVHQTADEALALQSSKDDHSALADAKDFLLNELAAGAVSAKDIKKQAESAGIMPRTLERAKAALGIKAVKLGMKEGWAWKLPKNANISEDCQP
jgi:putative DNA primase/helicase